MIIHLWFIKFYLKDKLSCDCTFIASLARTDFNSVNSRIVNSMKQDDPRLPSHALGRVQARLSDHLD